MFHVEHSSPQGAAGRGCFGIQETQLDPRVREDDKKKHNWIPVFTRMTFRNLFVIVSSFGIRN